MESQTYTAPESEPPALLRRLEALVERSPATSMGTSLPVGPVVAASLTGLRAEMTGLEERLAAIEDTVDALAERLESRIVAVDDRLAAQLQATTSEQDIAGKHRERTSEALQEQATALDEWAEAVRAGLEDLGDAVATSLGTLGETLQDPAGREADRRHLEAMMTEVLAAVDDATRPIDAQLSSLYGGVLDGFAAARDRLLQDLGDSLDALQRASVATRGNVEEQLVELRNDVADALDELREDVSQGVVGATGTVASSLEELRADWRPRTDSVIAEGRAAAQSVLADVQSEVRRAMTDLSDALEGQLVAIAGATGTLGGGTERLVAAGQALLAYLAERDRILERERDRVLREVLEEFAEDLTQRERRAVASRVGEAVDRRRDARDATRFRRTQAEVVDPDVPSVPDVVARLEEPLPTPVVTLPVSARRSLRPPAARAAAPAPAPRKRTATSAAAAKTAKKAAVKPVKKQPAKAVKPVKRTSATPPASRPEPPATDA